jgi:hypothetical protein
MPAVSWGELIEQRLDLASAGRAILYRFSIGLAFLQCQLTTAYLV